MHSLELHNGPLNMTAGNNSPAAVDSFRGGARVARRAVNAMVGGSNPSHGAMLHSMYTTAVGGTKSKRK